MHEFSGSTVPLPETEAVRAATGDPRVSIKARYGNVDGYIAAIEKAARALVQDGLMLEEDLEQAITLAQNWGAPRHEVRL